MYKWRHRDSVEDRSHTTAPKEPLNLRSRPNMPTFTHEQTINTSLGEVLQDFGQGWDIRSEHVGRVFEEGGRPDILIEKPDGWPVVLEAEVGNRRQAEIEAQQRLGNCLVSSETPSTPQSRWSIRTIYGVITGHSCGMCSGPRLWNMLFSLSRLMAAHHGSRQQGGFPVRSRSWQCSCIVPASQHGGLKPWPTIWSAESFGLPGHSQQPTPMDLPSGRALPTFSGRRRTKPDRHAVWQ